MYPNRKYHLLQRSDIQSLPVSKLLWANSASTGFQERLAGKAQPANRIERKRLLHLESAPSCQNLERSWLEPQNSSTVVSQIRKLYINSPAYSSLSDRRAQSALFTNKRSETGVKYCNICCRRNVRDPRLPESARNCNGNSNGPEMFFQKAPETVTGIPMARKCPF